MFLAVSIGNTNINFGFFTPAKLQSTRLFPIGDQKTLRHRIATALKDGGLASCPGAIIASVNPLAEDALVEVLADESSLPIFKAGRDLEIPIINKTEFPERVGVDRLLNALAAYRLKKGAVVVVDVGTAITVDAVSPKGEFLGGAIAPGLRLASLSLAEKTSLLPLVEVTGPSSAIGKNTEEAIKSGVFWGAVGLVDALVGRVWEQLGEDASVVLTGGDAPLIAPHSKLTGELFPHLTLEGLRFTLSDNAPLLRKRGVKIDL
jgi:type III pantothenate kinase